VLRAIRSAQITSQADLQECRGQSSSAFVFLSCE
jgi:hypothetical protein